MNITYSAQGQAEAKLTASLCRFCIKPLIQLYHALDTVVSSP